MSGDIYSFIEESIGVISSENRHQQTRRISAMVMDTGNLRKVLGMHMGPPLVEILGRISFMNAMENDFFELLELELLELFLQT